MNTDTAHRAILGLMQTYFDGLYHADTKRLGEIFHPDARYVNTVDGHRTNLSVPEYFALVDARTPPSQTGQVRRDRVLAIQIGGPNMAFARVEMAMMGRVYTDFLTLVFDRDRWWILAKVFHFDSET